MIRTVQLLLNTTRSPRYDIDLHIVPALNMAQESYIQDMYDDLKRKKRPYSFETFQRIKSSLRTIVVTEKPLVITGTLAKLPDDYRYDVGLNIVISGRKKRYSVNTTFNEDGPASQNAFDRPSVLEPKHLEHGEYIEVKFGGGLETLDEAYLDYVKNPSEMEVVSPALVQSSSQLAVDKRYWVLQGSVVFNSKTYTRDMLIEPSAAATFTGTGVLREIVDCELPENTHQEICNIAAALLSGTVENYERNKLSRLQAEES